MSTLTEQIAESIAAGEFPNTSPYWTPRERAENAQDYMELARPIAAVVAEWLTSPVTEADRFADNGFDPLIWRKWSDPLRNALAAEAVK